MNGPAPAERKQTSTWQMYRAIVGIGAFCAVLIVSVYKITAPQIKINQERFLAAAVAEVLPVAATTQAVTTDANGKLVTTDEPPELAVFLGYDAGG